MHSRQFQKVDLAFHKISKKLQNIEENIVSSNLIVTNSVHLRQYLIKLLLLLQFFEKAENSTNLIFHHLNDILITLNIAMHN